MHSALTLCLRLAMSCKHEGAGIDDCCSIVHCFGICRWTTTCHWWNMSLCGWILALNQTPVHSRKHQHSQKQLLLTRTMCEVSQLL